MKTIKLDPKRWLRGEPGQGKLLDKDTKKMCCMGFAALAFGAEKADIEEFETWGGCAVASLQDRDVTDDVVGVRRFDNLYDINDSDEIGSDAQRVKDLNAELERLGEDFRFALKKARR